MNDFSYPPMSKDMSKIGGIIYSSETSSFDKSMNIRSNSYSQSQEYDQWRSNSLPVNILSTPPLTSSNSDSPTINPATCDLQEIIIYYQSQPELLRLILLSKVEEDKRRTEEAKLRAKELDMVLLQQQQQQQQQINTSRPQTPDANIIPLSQPNMNNNCNMMTPINSVNNNNNNDNNNNSNNNNSNNNNNNLLNTNNFGQATRRPSALELLMDDTECDRRDSALGSSFDGSAKSDELDECNFSPNSTSAAASMLSMSFSTQPMISISASRSSLHPLSPPYNNIAQNQFTSQMTVDNNNNTENTCDQQQQQQQQGRQYDNYFPQRPRRRREMQAISKIVETRDFPYVDGFFWKNNGNTIQKKTGNKSVYYKCSNSSKGCPVNKTVTWRENGEYLIKYRGEHLAECGKVQRIVDM